MILFVPQSAQQIKEFCPSVLPLPAHGLDEFFAERLEEVAVADFGSVTLECLESSGWRVAFFFLEVVRDVAEEVEAFLGGPEEGVGHDVAGGGSAFGLLVDHGADEVFGFVGEVAEDF